jgi:hypothetical protein
VKVAKKRGPSREVVVAERRLTGTDDDIVQQLDDMIASLIAFRNAVSTAAVRSPRRRKGPTGRRVKASTVAAAALLLVLAPAPAQATPTTTFWAPSTASCQARGVPHVTYDTYFWKGPGAGGAGAPNYPIDTGLTIGVLPSDKLQGEVGFDLLLPSQDPIYLNAKLCTPESSLFRGSPGISFGIYNVGFEEDVTDYNVLHLMFQKALPTGGYVSAGLYHGFNRTLFTNSDGDVVQTGAMIGVGSPDIPIGLRGLKKITLAADVQTGKNVLGAWGFGTYVYFADTVSLLVGPVFFLDKDLQPGGSKYMWTAQLDVDIPLGR